MSDFTTTFSIIDIAARIRDGLLQSGTDQQLVGELRLDRRLSCGHERIVHAGLPEILVSSYTSPAERGLFVYFLDPRTKPPPPWALRGLLTHALGHPALGEDQGDR